MMMQKGLILLAGLLAGTPAATVFPRDTAMAAAATTATAIADPTADSVIILTGPAFTETAANRIDEYFRDLLQYDIRGSQHTYRVIVGQTTLEELASLEDVTCDEIYRDEGKISRLTLAGGGITFRAGDESDRIVSVEYAPADIPAIWATRYAIDREVLTRSERRLELGTAGIEWEQSVEAAFWINAYEEYAVKTGDEKLISLTMFLDGSDLSLIRVQLQPDGQGHYPRLAAVSADGRIGGFLQNSFGRLRLENTERTISLDEALKATSLSIWTLVNRPLGILPGRATLSDARRALAQHPDWEPVRSGSSGLRLTPENGYDLDFEGEIPEAKVFFYDSGETSPVKFFSFCFHFTRGEAFMDDTTDTALRLNAERLAMRIVSELQLLGYRFDERNDTASGKQSWHHGSSLRSVNIYVLQQSRFQPDDTFSTLIRVQLPRPQAN